MILTDREADSVTERLRDAMREAGCMPAHHLPNRQAQEERQVLDIQRELTVRGLAVVDTSEPSVTEDALTDVSARKGGMTDGSPVSTLQTKTETLQTDLREQVAREIPCPGTGGAEYTNCFGTADRILALVAP